MEGAKLGEVAVVGGGIAGIQAALDLADTGFKVYLIERSPSIGGRMAQLDKTFPTLDCASCILTPKMAEVLRKDNIELLTLAEVVDVIKNGNKFKLTIKQRPRYVDTNKCTGCGTCVEKCTARGKLGAPDEFNEGLSTRTAVYIPFPQAVPKKAVIDPNICLRLRYKRGCGICEKVCPANAINFNDTERILNLTVDAVIVATGYKFIDPRLPELSIYGYGKYPEVYTNIEFERILDARGPTGGALIKKDGSHPERIVFIQCVGSRHYKINPYCSAYCCMASIKQAILAKEHEPKVDVTILYMDIRAYGKGFQDFYNRAENEYGIRFIKGRTTGIIEDPSKKKLIVKYEDVMRGTIETMETDMVVLALGIVPNIPSFLNKLGIVRNGRVITRSEDPISTYVDGIFVIGATLNPTDIPDAVLQGSAAAARVTEHVLRRKTPFEVMRS
jgi:heterodisulfide reductase subunit A